MRAGGKEAKALYSTCPGRGRASGRRQGLHIVCGAGRAGGAAASKRVQPADASRPCCCLLAARASPTSRPDRRLHLSRAAARSVVLPGSHGLKMLKPSAAVDTIMPLI